MPTRPEGSSSAQQSATGRNIQKIQADVLRDYLFGRKELTQQQRGALDLLLRGLSDAQVATELGVDRGTVFRWRKSPHFALELDQQRRALLEQSTARLQSLLDPALDILQKQLAGDDPKTQLRAAAILVRLATPGRVSRASATASLAADNKAESDEQFRRLEAYVNAPMPGRTSLDEDDDVEGAEDVEGADDV